MQPREHASTFSFGTSMQDPEHWYHLKLCGLLRHEAVSADVAKQDHVVDFKNSPLTVEKIQSMLKANSIRVTNKWMNV